MAACRTCQNLPALCYTYSLRSQCQADGWIHTLVYSDDYSDWFHIKRNSFYDFICLKILMTPAARAVWIRARVQDCTGGWVGRRPGCPIVGHSSPGRSRGETAAGPSAQIPSTGQRHGDSQWHTHCDGSKHSSSDEHAVLKFTCYSQSSVFHWLHKTDKNNDI